MVLIKVATHPSTYVAGKWVKIDRWGNADEARAEIVKAVNAYQK